MKTAPAETFIGTVEALAGFIAENRNFALPSDSPGGDRSGTQDPRSVLQHLSTLPARMEREGFGHWDLCASALALFLAKAPDLRDAVAPISMTGLNISRESSFDPLTYAGLTDVLHFIHNGLLDDCWIAAYEDDGDLRVVNEAIDDAIRAGKGTKHLRRRGRLDKGDDWLRAAERTYLDSRSFHKVFGSHLEGIVPSVPTRGELMAMWMSRPYDDFAPGPRP